MSCAFTVPFDIHNKERSHQTLMQMSVWCICRYEGRSGMDYVKYLNKERREDVVRHLQETLDISDKDQIYDGLILESDTWFVGLITFNPTSNIDSYIYVRVPNDADAVELRLSTFDVMSPNS
jgi:hypothetical protein